MNGPCDDGRENTVVLLGFYFSIQAFKNTLWSFENFWRVLFLILFFRFEAVAQPPFYCFMRKKSKIWTSKNPRKMFLDFKVFSHFRKTQNWQQHLIFTNLNLLPLVRVCLSAVYLDNWSGYQLVIFICINKYIFFCFHTASFKMLTLSNHKCWKKNLENWPWKCSHEFMVWKMSGFQINYLKILKKFAIFSSAFSNSLKEKKPCFSNDWKIILKNQTCYSLKEAKTAFVNVIFCVLVSKCFQMFCRQDFKNAALMFFQLEMEPDLWPAVTAHRP